MVLKLLTVQEKIEKKIGLKGKAIFIILLHPRQSPLAPIHFFSSFFSDFI